jgi:4a-hydroxytetrahydrobiopterin dehydratase
MSDLRQKHCQACEGGTPPLSTEAIHQLQAAIHSAWQLTQNGTALSRSFRARNHYEIMAFVNAIAFISHQEDHHPELCIGYNSCQVTYTTHAINGLSENDFICAAKVDGLNFSE